MVRSPVLRGVWQTRRLLVALLALLVLATAPSTAEPPGDSPASRVAEKILEVPGTGGGLVVQLGCHNAELAAAIGRALTADAKQGYVLHALDVDAAAVRRTRHSLRSHGLYGPAAADVFNGRHLPYIDNVIRLLVVGSPCDVDRAEMLRVLRPGGMGLLLGGDGESVAEHFTKPRPGRIDEWTHYLYDATNNAVSQDTTVDVPGRLQWLGSPRWARHHDHMSSASAMVSADGRLFSIFDEGSTASILLPAKWALVARDAFSGVVLWKRSIAQWHPHLFKLKSGPSNLPRRLVAQRDRVYVTLGLDAPLSALDAATGRTLRTYQGTRATEEVILSDGFLLLVTTDDLPKQPAHPRRFVYDWAETRRHVMAVRADSGEVLWKKSFPWVVPLTLAADAAGVYFHDGRKIVCLDRRQGTTRWESEPVERARPLPSFYAPTLVVYDGVVLFTGGANQVPHKGADDTMTALSAETGKKLWTAPHPPSGYQSPEDILVVDGLVWTGNICDFGASGHFTGRDPRTGEVKRDFLPEGPQRYGHHRCYRSKATERYVLTSRSGIEFFDVEALDLTPKRWVRGGCLYGIMPANGLIYTPAHDCVCSVESKLFGFCALGPANKPQSSAGNADTPKQRSPEGRLEKGPAYAAAGGSTPSDARVDDWPTYRRDAQRSGFTPHPVPSNLARTWQTRLGGTLTAPVVAGGRVYVASRDTHTLYVLDAASGRQLWDFTAGGRIDSPPTIVGDRVLFGSADGRLYCLRPSDGAVVWRFLAAPEDRRLVAWEQLESVWPLHGNVLVHDGVLWCACGRSVFLDGGLRLLRLDAATGKQLSQTELDGKGRNVGLSDILSCDGRHVYLRSQVFDLEGKLVRVPDARDVLKQQGETAHLFCPTGFLDDSWWHRSYWVFGRTFAPGATGYFMAGRFAPSGKLLVFDETTVYGYSRKPQYFRWTSPLERQLFASSKEPEILRTPMRKPKKPRRAINKAHALSIETRNVKTAKHWTGDLPLQVCAMVLADTTLFVAGPPDLIDEEQALAAFDTPQKQKQLARQAAALEGDEGALLWAVAADDGRRVAEIKLPGMPVFDGLIASSGSLYVSTVDGRVERYSGK